MEPGYLAANKYYIIIIIYTSTSSLSSMAGLISCSKQYYMVRYVTVRGTRAINCGAIIVFKSNNHGLEVALLAVDIWS